MADFQLNVKINGVEQSVKTIGQLEKALAETNAELAMVDQGSREFKFLQNQAQNLDKVIVELNKDTADFNKNIKTVTQSSEQLNKSFTQTTEVASNGIGKATSSTQSLRTELRKITQELQGLEPGSARFQELSVRAGQLRDTIGDTSAVINSLAGSSVERLGKALSSTTQVGIAGFQGITSVQAIFGTENEEIQKSLVKLTALLNLSQSIETFGNLGDKITEIKAGFSSLFPAATAAATATTGLAAAEGAEAVAAGGAAVATTAFGTALNLLPFVAIITGIGLLTAAVIKYATSADEVNESQKIFAERQKRIAEETKNQREEISKEAGSFATLIARLKSTNAGTKERVDLIKEINKDYGTTLTNLRDETLFQESLNKELESYLIFTRAKFDLQNNEDKIIKVLAKQDEIQIKLNKSKEDELKQQRALDDYYKGNPDAQTPTFLVEALDKAQKSSAKLQGELDNANKRYVSYGKSAQEAAEQVDKITESGSKYVEQNDKIDKSLEKLKTAQEETVKSSIQFSQEADDNERELERRRIARTEDKIDDLEFERDINLAKIIQEYQAQKKAIDLNIKDEAIKTETLKRLDADYQRFIKSENDKTSLAIDIELSKRLQDQQDFYDELILAEQVLQKEITFGNSNIGDSLDSLDQRVAQIEITRLTREIESGKLSVKDFESRLEERERLQAIFDERQRNIQNDLVESERVFQLTEVVKYYASLGKFEIEQDEKTKKFKVKLSKTYEEDVSKLGKVALDNAETEAILTENVINTTAVNLNKEATTKKLENEVQYNNKRKDDSKLTDEEILNNRLGLANQLIQIFQGFADAAGEIEAARIQSENQKQTAANESFILSQQSRVDALEAAYQRELEVGNLTEEQKLAKRKQTDEAIAKITTDTNKAIDLSNEDLAKKQFKRQKALNITNAIISGAQAVMSAIAQFGPPPSPAGIAGIAAAGIITVAQIAAISKQQYNGGSTGVTGITTPSTSTTTTPTVSQPAVSSTGGFTSFSNGVGQATGASTTPMTGSMTSDSQRVYVVESDITEVQRRVRVTEEGASFG